MSKIRIKGARTIEAYKRLYKHLEENFKNQEVWAEFISENRAKVYNASRDEIYEFEVK